MNKRYFFHAFLSGCLLLLSMHSSAQSTQQLAQALEKAFITESSEALEPYLSADFSIGAYSMPSAVNLLKVVLQRYPCQAVKAEKQIQAEKVVPLRLQVEGSTDPVLTGMHLDAQGKIKYIDVFDQLYGMDRYRESEKLVSVPFENVEGSIILEVKINDYPRPLRLLFDTGADGMALSKTLADSIGLEISRQQQTSVVGGHVEIQVSTNNTIHLENFSVDQQSIAIFPEFSRNTDGIIGNSLLKRFITEVNYDSQTFSLYSFGSFDYANEGFTLPVRVPSGNIELPATVHIGDGEPVEGNFFFDSGAGYNAILFRPFVKAHNLLLNGFKPDSVTNTVSMGMQTPVFNGRAHEFMLHKDAVVKNMPIALMGNSRENKDWNPGGAGSIGVGLLQNFNFTVNLMEKEIHFSPVAKPGS